MFEQTHKLSSSSSLSFTSIWSSMIDPFHWHQPSSSVSWSALSRTTGHNSPNYELASSFSKIDFPLRSNNSLPVGFVDIVRSLTCISESNLAFQIANDSGVTGVPQFFGCRTRSCSAESSANYIKRRQNKLQQLLQKILPLFPVVDASPSPHTWNLPKTNIIRIPIPQHEEHSGRSTNPWQLQ